MNTIWRKIQSLLENIAIPNLTRVLVFGSALCYVFVKFRPEFSYSLTFVPDLVLKGEYWRVLAFPFFPLDMSPIFAFFTYYFFYFMGTALEAEWGEVKYTRYILLAVIATVAFSFLHPLVPATNGFITGSIFLAFAFLFPDFLIYLFFFIPVKVKYVAALTWAGYIWALIAGDWATRISVLVVIANFLIFFYRDLMQIAAVGKHEMQATVKLIEEKAKAFHVCAACGLTEKKDPVMDFRVCSLCQGGLEYCLNHLKDHTHRA